jgi:hypothetical protein
MLPGHEEREPLTPFERGFFAFTAAVFLGLMAAEVIRDYQPGKLAAVFFLLWWPVLLVLHESGHALAALLVGWRVERFVIGFGRVVYEFRLGNTAVQFRLFPLSGFVRPEPGDLTCVRFKLAFLYFAGPGIELLTLAFLGGLIGPARLLTRTTEVPMIAMQAMGVAILFGAITNLIPFSFETGRGTGVSDGLGVWRSLFAPRDSLFTQASEPDENEWDRQPPPW